MNILMVHLSDIHFKADCNSIFQKKDMLSRAIISEVLDVESVLFMISGDIAYSGKDEEYILAIDFIEYIKEKIYDERGVKCYTFIAQGNHDCQHKKETKSTRDVTINAVRDNNELASKEDIVNKCCEVQSSFFDFEDLLYDNDPYYSNKLLKIFNIKFGDNEEFKISINCYNSAWMSSLPEEPSKLYFPIKDFKDVLSKNKTSLSISMMHHPSNWNTPENKRVFQDVIERTSDIVLTGHEHVGTVSTKNDFYGNTTEYIEGKVLQDSKNHNISGFNILKIRLEDQVHDILEFEYETNLYSKKKHSRDVAFMRCRNNPENKFSIKKEFEKFLEDPGANYSVPNKEEVYLEDVFVYPTVSKNGLINGSNERVERISSEMIFGFKEESNRKIIMGAENSGKTTLCKTGFKVLFNKHYIPIMFNASDIRSFEIDNILKFLSKKFTEQYTSSDENFIELFEQTSNEKKVLIIEDINELRGNDKFKTKFFENINKYFKNILVTGNDLTLLENIIQSKEYKFSNITDYEHYSILEFGHQGRMQLINKWYKIGADYLTDEKELMLKGDLAKRKIDIIIGKNFIPSYPIFILTMLQTMELGNNHEMKKSSYGHYYQVLITKAFCEMNIKDDELDAYYNFLTELSNQFYIEGREYLVFDLIEKFHRWFCEEEYEYSNSFKRFVNFESLMENLVKANLLQLDMNGVRFRYNYLYYYFISKYFADNITDEKVRCEIKRMSKSLHVERNANIFLFLIHHSKNPFILDCILENSKELFSNFEVIKLENDIGIINNLVDKIPKIIMENRNVEDVRNEKLKKKDELELKKMYNDSYESTLDEVAAESEGENEELDEMIKINIAFKTIQILGQILKNHWGGLKGIKRRELCEEAFYISLRALNSFFSQMQKNMDYLIKDVEFLVKEMEVESNSEKEKKARELIFNLCNQLAYFFIKKVSEDIGYDKLSKTFERIKNENDFTSIGLIDISIKLENNKDFPYEEVGEMKETIGNNFFSEILLKKLTVDYLYMFEPKYSNRQRICELMDIPIKNSILIGSGN